MRRLAVAAPTLAAVLLLACGNPAPPGSTTAAPAVTANVPAPVEAPAPAAPPPPAAAGDIGTANPIVLEAVAADGAWVAVCQARRDTNNDGEVAVYVGHHGDTFGDDFVPYLVRGGGEGEELRSFIAATNDGRWLVAKRQQALALLDTKGWTWTELPGADLRDDGVPIGPHRNASLAADGDRLAYLRGDDTIVIRELASGRERTVAVPRARVWRVEVDAAGAWARVYLVRKDTDGNGQLDWPTLRSSLSDRDCRGPIMSYSTGGWQGDAFETLWLDLATGALVDEGAVVLGAAGPHLVRKLATGALTLDGTAVAPPACQAELIALAATPPRVLYSCKPKRGTRTVVEVAGPGGVHTTTALGIERDPDRDPIKLRGRAYCSGGHCLDLATTTLHKLPGSDDPLAGDGARYLVTDGTALSILDLDRGTTSPLALTGDRGHTSDAIVAIDQHLLDLATGRDLGTITGTIVAVDNRGRALIGPDDRGRDLPIGPLRWVLPQ